MKYVFKKLQDNDNQSTSSTLILKSDAESLDKLINDFENFLRGSGFVFSGSLVIDDYKHKQMEALLNEEIE